MALQDSQPERSGRMAAFFLLGLAVVVGVLVLIGAFMNLGRVSHVPMGVSVILDRLRDGVSTGYMGVAVLLVLFGPPCGMLLAAFERRREDTRSVWVALATFGVFGLSILFTLLT